ncbi:hypothetical protein RCL_jg3316.t1 [Rhizophagus clarus]|uniref:Secreted protein n=1 Tax=Rhizophagus clarus TaxID=94130 RepID=A0A8H3MAB2_9GLOM|nr:hypothetical protein RCL_jg3316.t1 [Rhizophagus clarus]
MICSFATTFFSISANFLVLSFVECCASRSQFRIHFVENLPFGARVSHVFEVFHHKKPYVFTKPISIFRLVDRRERNFQYI